MYMLTLHVYFHVSLTKNCSQYENLLLLWQHLPFSGKEDRESHYIFRTNKRRHPSKRFLEARRSTKERRREINFDAVSSLSPFPSKLSYNLASCQVLSEWIRSMKVQIGEVHYFKLTRIFCFIGRRSILFTISRISK